MVCSTLFGILILISTIQHDKLDKIETWYQIVDYFIENKSAAKQEASLFNKTRKTKNAVNKFLKSCFYLFICVCCLMIGAAVAVGIGASNRASSSSFINVRLCAIRQL